MRNTFVDTVIEASKKRDDLFIISGDAGLGVFDEFTKTAADKFLNLGVAEQNAASFAAGMSLAGFKVYLYNIIPFVLYRCYEQVRNDICYQKLPVVLVGIGSGVTYAPQGMTHYSIEDIGIARTMPNLRIFSPIDPVEARLAAWYSLSAKDPVYVRLAKRGEPAIHKKTDFNICEPQMLADGDSVAVVFHGSIAPEALKAADILRDSGIHPRLISAPLIHPLNHDCLFRMVNDMRHVISLEEHYIHCGLGNIIAGEYVTRKPSWELHTLGIPADFIHEIKDTAGMRDHFGISGAKIADYIKKIIP